MAIDQLSGVELRENSLGELTKLNVHARSQDSESYAELLDRVKSYLDEQGYSPVLEFVLGAADQDVQSVSKSWPTVWLKGDPANSDEFDGLQIIAVKGAEVTPLYSKGKVIGAKVEDSFARYFWYGGLVGEAGIPRKEQCRQIFELMDDVLKAEGLSFDNTARTWLYLKKLLDWYDDLNEVRTKFFNENDTFNKLVPASTGIGAYEPTDRDMVAALYAVDAKVESTKVFEVESPLQCPALDYKSSFARAVEIQSGDSREIMVSGTASIEPGGLTVYQDDIPKQIALTMEVVEEILKNRQMSWQDVTRTICYHKDNVSREAFAEYLSAKGLTLPLSEIHADVCRDDLLFEIELDAAQ